MSYEEIAIEALERAEKATEGPFRVLGKASKGLRIVAPDGSYIAVFHRVRSAPIEEQYANAVLMSAARQDVPALARAVLEQKETIEGQQKRNRQLAHELSAALDVCEAVAGLYKPLPEGAKTLSDLEAVGRAYRKWAGGARSST